MNSKKRASGRILALVVAFVTILGMCGPVGNSSDQLGKTSRGGVLIA